jgi:hypothetical protein
MQGAFDAAFGVDSNKTSRLTNGMEAAFGAQDLHDMRAFKGFEQDIMLGDKTADIYSREKLLEAGLSEDQVNAILGAATDEANAETATSNAETTAYIDALKLGAEAYKNSGTAGGTTAGNTGISYSDQLTKPNPP